MKKVGVYLDIDSFSGGKYQYNIALLKALSELPSKEYEIVGICATEEWEKWCVNNNILFYHYSIKRNIFFVLTKILEMIRANTLVTELYEIQDIFQLKEKKIDICIFPQGNKQAGFIKTPSIATIHDLMHRYERRFPEMGNTIEYFNREYKLKAMVNNCYAILTDSQLGKQQVEESYLNGIKNNKIKVLPFIPPTYVYENDKLQYEDDWNEIKEKIPDKFFFYPAQFWEHKNHIGILRAIDKLKNDMLDIHVVFAGSRQNGYLKIQKFIDQHKLEKNVTILGYVSNYSTVQLYKKAIALIMASYIGPTNIPPIEALYLGCPVIAAEVYATPEQLGDAALLFPPEDIVILADEMKLVWENGEVRKRLIEEGYKRSKLWGEKEFAERLHEIMNEVSENM